MADLSLPRCFGGGSDLYADYHDAEWGVPVRDDRTLFEMLILEGAHAGLSWETVLRKREGYRARFHGFDVGRCAAMDDGELTAALRDPGIVRHRQKVASVPRNAAAFAAIQREAGAFSDWLWSWVGDRPVDTAWPTRAGVPAVTPLAEAISKDLRGRGMSFVGPTIVYAYLQAVGVVNDHFAGCWVRRRAGPRGGRPAR
ncbi:MAG: DNA-3-methyladenine glycosylase I [Hasllibacter sp.]